MSGHSRWSQIKRKKGKADVQRGKLFSKTWRISGPVRLRLSVRTWIRRATPPGAYPSYVTSSYDSPGTSPVPFWIARLMLS